MCISLTPPTQYLDAPPHTSAPPSRIACAPVLWGRMGNRQLKRSWLLLVQEAEGAKGKAAGTTPLSTSAIDATLGRIQGDNLWVALACIDVIGSQAHDVSIARHLIQLGLERTNVVGGELGQAIDATSQQLMHKLAFRKVIMRYKRMVHVWDQVYGPKADSVVGKWDNKADKSAAGEESEEADDFDAWAEVAESTPSPVVGGSIRMALSDFIQQTPLSHAIQLASSFQPVELRLLIKALPPTFFTVVEPHRLSITKLLLLSAASAEADLELLHQLRLLPGIENGNENDVWAECKQQRDSDPDLTDEKNVCDALSQLGLLPAEDAVDWMALKEPVTAPLLVSFYKECVTALEGQAASIRAAIQLATIVSSNKLGLPRDGSITLLQEDLSLLLPLVYGASASSQSKSWTLSRFREELAGRVDLEQRQRMASLYLEGANLPREALEGARNGALPFLRLITQRYAQQMDERGQVNDMVRAGFVRTLLTLADKEHITIVRSVLEGSKDCGVELDPEEVGKACLACLLGSTKLDQSTMQEAERLATFAMSLFKAVAWTGNEQPLREYVGPALHQGVGNVLLPSQVFCFLGSLDGPSLRYHLERCRLYLDAYHRLAAWNGALNLPWLANAQGQREEQLGCVTRIVRSFAREPKSQQQWSSLVDSITRSVGSGGALDALQDKDVGRLVVEGALRTGDMRTFAHVLSQHGVSQLADAEQEEIILNASREYYDNATLANLHQGDMKIAYEILAQYGPPTTPRIEQEKGFIEASSRLCSFRIQSALRPGVLLSPIEIRLSHDRLDLIKRLLESREDAYKTPDSVLEMAVKLCAVPSGSPEATVEVFSRPLVEAKTLALLTEAALGQADYAQAQASCERLVSNVAALGKRVEQSGATQGRQHEQVVELHRRVSEIAHRSCFYLCNQHEWKDVANRLRWASYVLAYCPDDQVERYLKTWRELERQFQQDLVLHPPKDWDEVAVQLKPGQAGLASSLASIGGLSALESLSPFSTLFASTGLTGLSRSGSQDGPHASASSAAIAREAPRPTSSMSPPMGSPSSRTAKLFDSFGGGNPSSDHGHPSGYLDPAERAARAARRFFGGFGTS